jgi:RNA-directed DNA polymerase
MLERAREVTRNGKYTYIEYARFADDLVILIDAYKRHDCGGSGFLDSGIS